MAENTDNSAFAATVGRLGELTESELRQLYLIVGVRLGYPGGLPQVAASGSKSQKQPGRTAAKGSKAKSGTSRGKGNPQRKSQWANHPLYQRYASLKKRVEAQAKEANTSFNSVNTAESREYREALSQWLEAKSSFRDRGEGTKDHSDEESEEDEVKTSSRPATAASAATGASPSNGKAPATTPPKAAGATGATSSRTATPNRRSPPAK